MTLDTNSETEQVLNVQDSDGEAVKPASADFVHYAVEGRGINAAPLDIEIDAPDRAAVATVCVDDLDDAAEVRLHFQAIDGDGTRKTITSRSSDDNPDYASDGTSAIFIQTEIASPYLRLEVDDTSGGSNTADISVYVR